NGENILQSIDEGPFKMGKFRETLTEGALHLGLERDIVIADLTPAEKEWYKGDIHRTNILLQGLPKDIYTLIKHYTDAKDIWDNVKMLLEGSELTKDEHESQLYDDFEHFPHANENKMMLERYTQHAIDPLAFMSNISPQQYPTQSSAILQSAYVPPVTHQPQFADNTQLDSVQNNRVVVQNVQHRHNRGKGNNARGALVVGIEGFQNRVGNAYPGQAKPIKCYNCNGTNMFDDDVDEAPLQDLALNKDHIFQADQCDAFDSNIDDDPPTQTMFMENLSLADPIYDEAGPSYDSDIISEVQDHDNYLDSVDEYQEYVKNNVEQVVQNNVSSVPNDALMMIINDMHDQAAQCVYAKEQNKVANESLTAELARYKEQVAIYEKKERFELTKREQKIDEQLRVIITDRNIKEESLKKELYSVKMQLNSTIDHNKLIKDKVATLKKDFKKKENKYLEDFLDMKALKEKVKDKLFKQDQSLQTVHMLCKPKPFYDEKKKVAIGYKNPLYLTSVMQVLPALYNGYEIVKTNHAPAVMHDSEDTLEIANKTRKKMLEKMKSPLCVEKRVNIAPPDYLKENYLATFTPQRHLTPEQIFWSLHISIPKPISEMTVYPPNTPAKLVPRVLPTKSQVKINIYTPTQLFTKFDKTCKKRITPCGLTEGERGYKQTKECYLTEVIPFFKMLKEHFEGIQSALVKEVKGMKEIFKQMEAEVEQNAVDKQCADIERKNLLIENENLIVDCLSNELLYSVMNVVNTVSRFSEMHDAYTVELANVSRTMKTRF
ncbi:hypothetical protein Tco_1098818, partial [Tanacetum coccineum]